MTKYTTRKRTDYIVLHCAYTKRSQRTPISEIRRWHVEERGWLDVGYYLYIRFDGSVEIGRPIDAVGAHVAGYNAVSVGVCLEGGMGEDGLPTNNFTREQWEVLTAVVESLTNKYPGAEVLGHRDFPDVNKACPCFNARKWWFDASMVGTSYEEDPVPQTAPIGTPVWHDPRWEGDHPPRPPLGRRVE